MGFVRPSAFAGKKFTDDWIKCAEEHEANWRAWTSHLAGKPINILEIGAFEGRSALVWRKLHPESTIYCIDIFGGEHEKVHPGYEARFDANTRDDAKIVKLTGTSEMYLAQGWEVRLDIVYVDGDHHAGPTYRDAELAWPHLRPGGVLVFDDYQWRFGHSPKEGIDRFCEDYGAELKLVAKGWQVAIRKTVGCPDKLPGG
ncbi:MAG TPA: class I SAM-dependent methyltransferase [Labilithrix sp.]|jgi:predicted O-methyltransferase YrrM|nr:class I SAM-dependent methyltransferase [Labilithrix sp.]